MCDTALYTDLRYLSEKLRELHMAMQKMKWQSKNYTCMCKDIHVYHENWLFSARTPEYTIVREPLEGEIPEFLVMEIKLPGIVREE